MHTVKDILATKGNQVATIEGGTPVLQAAVEMNTRRIGALVVMDGEKIAGIFTERDIMNRVVAAQRSPAETTVADVMTSEIVCCEPSATVAECNAVMTQKRLRHLPVVEGGRLVGIVSTGDIIAREVEIKSQTIHYLHEYLYGPS